MALTACFEPSTDSGEQDAGIEPPSGLFGGDAGPTGDGGGTACTSSSPLSSMEIRVRTTTTGGRFSPRNVGAIWIENDQGIFVKTVERWAATRASRLVAYQASAHNNVVDAITSATLANHVTHDRTWNLKDLTECEIHPGNYRVRIEMTDKNAAGPNISIPFTMGTAPVHLTPAETTNFHDLLIDLK